MYKVYLDHEILQDSSTFLIDPKLDLAKNTAGSFSFGMYPEHPLYDSITPTSVIKVVQVLDDTERWIWSGRLSAPSEDFNLYRSFEAEGVLAYLSDSIQRPAEYHDISVIDFLSALLEIHNSQVDDFKKIHLGVVTVTDPNDSLYRYTNYEDTLSVIKDKLIDRLGGILRIRHESDGLYIDYLADYPRLSTQELEFGENLMDLLKESSYADVATVVIPLGARLEDEEKSPDWPEALEQRITIASVNEGKDYLIDNAAAASNGRIVKVVTWDDVHIPSILKTKAQQYLDLAKYESCTITAKAIDLSTAGFDVDDFRFLDRIRIVSEPHGVDLVFPLPSMTIYLLEPEKNVYTLGSETKSYTSSQSRSQVTIEESLASMPARISEAREKAIANATQILQQWAEIGYAVHTENESYYMDHPDKTKAKNVLRINSGGIGFSKTGFNGPYVSAWTIDGVFNADFITAGTISAERIDIVYRDEVVKKITDGDSASKEYTDALDQAVFETLTNQYWTKASIETAIKNAGDTIQIYAHETAYTAAAEALEDAKADTDNKLLAYTKTADFSVAPSQIKSELTSAKTYAEEKASAALRDAKADTDDKLLDYLPASQTYSRNVIDQKLSDQENSITLRVEGGVQDIFSTRALWTCLSSSLTTPLKSQFTIGTKTPTESQPYCWGFERLTLSDQTVVDDTIRVMAMYGEPGEDGISIVALVTEYCRSTSNTIAPTAGYSETMPEIDRTAAYFYLWERQKITKSDGSVSYTNPVLNHFWKQLSSDWAQIKTEQDNISLEVGKKVGTDEIISRINQSAEKIAIDAPKINLNGAVTANNHFKINTDGSFSAQKGNIGSFEIDSGCFFYKDKDETWYESDQLAPNGTSIYMGKHGFGTSQPYGLDVALLSWGHLFFKSMLDDGTNRMVSLSGTSETDQVSENKEAKLEVVDATGTNGSGVILFDVSRYSALIRSKTVRLRGDNTYVNGNFMTSGSKSRVIDTDQFGEIAQFAYETATPFFGDIGRGVIGEDGTISIFMDPIFAESIDMGDVHVFLQQLGKDPIYLTKVESTHFVVEGKPGTSFSWELKARQKGYTDQRLYTDKASKPDESIEEYAEGFLSDLEPDFLQDEGLF